MYLFGSRARGEAGPDSDYDLLLVVPDDASPERQRSRLAYEVLHGTGVAADVLVCTRTWFDRREGLKASLPGTILREGAYSMPPDDVRLEDARAWLAKAELDLRAADLELGTPAAGLWGDVAFHAQQAAEKALKAFLALHDEPFRKTHSIEQIGRACTVIDPRPVRQARREAGGWPARSGRSPALVRAAATRAAKSIGGANSTRKRGESSSL